MTQIFEDTGKVRIGTYVKLADFPDILDEVTEITRLSGISKGKGFAGVVKRYHFNGGPATHGQSDRERHPGSSGQTTTPGRVYKGKRRAGRMGNDRVTLTGIEILKKDKIAKTLLVACPVPGAYNGPVILEIGKN